MVVVMLPGMFAMPLATALVMPMNPSVMVFPPIPGYPHPFVAIVPIARTVGIIRPITHVDREPDRQGAWPDQHANRQESHCKNRKFRFHSVVNCSYEAIPWPPHIGRSLGPPKRLSTRESVRSWFTSALRWGATRMTREAPRVAATLTFGPQAVMFQAHRIPHLIE
jgi:hypothetical protein